MTLRFQLLACSALVFFVSLAEANSGRLGSVSRRADSVENKRVEKQMWSQSQTNSMMNKSFPIEKWDKHYSSLGGKRSAISVSESKDKQMFQTKTFERKEISFEMSRWNDRMADLHKQAGIDMDARAQLVADKQLYYMMLQDSERFREMAEEVSLRDLNRYQFRRNHSDGDLPVEKAGSR
ncbi:hypothetical protein SH580_17750 [Coraliomargarita algicola]|uniref:Uncharacterized protein n=1 Tax=Coraliomargarita algicola TaxID=3092156 RepID=A0ABZ0RQR0_9BACT|nr:hypothetical protein [Coraliomargarita sp. J2-16]WPJ95269.1 hypothetical protein SH580_17750 [Coraliomargarita sp. J2-16]